MAYEKDPTEKKDYAVDWSKHLGAGETITTSTWSISPSGLTQSQASSTNTVATLWLSSGTVGVEYRVTNHVVTNQGREFERSFVVNVADL